MLARFFMENGGNEHLQKTRKEPKGLQCFQFCRLFKDIVRSEAGSRSERGVSN